MHQDTHKCGSSSAARTSTPHLVYVLGSCLVLLIPLEAGLKFQEKKNSNLLVYNHIKRVKEKKITKLRKLYTCRKMFVLLGMDLGVVGLVRIGEHGAFGANDGTHVISQQTVCFDTCSPMTWEVNNPDLFLCDPSDLVAHYPFTDMLSFHFLLGGKLIIPPLLYRC